MARNVGPALVAILIGCGPGEGRAPIEPEPDAKPCEGIACQLVDCEKLGMPPTTISGTVFAPNGTLALHGAQVYVPASEPGPLPLGVGCGHCSDPLSGGSLASAISDAAGQFTLTNVPAGLGVPVVITMGRWRRQVTMPGIVACTDNPIAPWLTSL